MWKLRLRPRYSSSGNIFFKFSAFFLCSAIKVSIADNFRTYDFFYRYSKSLTRPLDPRSGADLLLNVHKTPSWAISRKESIVWDSSIPMPSLWIATSRLNGRSGGRVGSLVYEGLIGHCVQVQYRGAAGGELYGGRESAAGQSHLVHQPRAGMHPQSCVSSQKIFYLVWLLKLHSKLGNKCIWGI